MSQTISALFDSRSDASAAIRELEASGIDRDDISIVSNNENTYDEEVAKDAGTGAGIGAAIGGAGGLLAGLGLMAIPGVGPVVAAGWLVSTAAGAVAGGLTGGIVGALTEAGVPSDDAEFYAEGIRRGGTLVGVRLDDDANGSQVRSILQRNKYVEPTARMRFYQDSGWTGYDESAKPYTRDQITQERSRYTR